MVTLYSSVRTGTFWQRGHWGWMRMCLYLTKGQKEAIGDLHIGDDGVYNKEGKTKPTPAA